MDVDSYTDGNSDAHGHADNSGANRYADGYIHDAPDAHRHGDANADAAGYIVGDSDAHGHADSSDANRYADAHPDFDGYTDKDPGADIHIDDDSDLHRHADVYAYHNCHPAFTGCTPQRSPACAGRGSGLGRQRHRR